MGLESVAETAVTTATMGLWTKVKIALLLASVISIVLFVHHYDNLKQDSKQLVQTTADFKGFQADTDKGFALDTSLFEGNQKYETDVANIKPVDDAPMSAGMRSRIIARNAKGKANRINASTLP